mmetsp:Transcript_13312/g.33397  ORF Transcript_13312/g.33397 Transcript_13312/m.33397 type:complete len:612 (+) Transcript_13312:137-1972(+)|eukprot:CAMPEP_0115260362 /NCGR_PEP_ID=MMETSP0270-20121206/48298_1 /TAXON_ID=71861 /ORGANISM="Scrippsiella trochoidea, Strain CCMP3099" /LENGTH=611 /DNA_ID=CAMNT_0002676195 /DNA_START=79 /DNA_END=1914 /DNA_ORIENTATION=-
MPSPADFCRGDGLTAPRYLGSCQACVSRGVDSILTESQLPEHWTQRHVDDLRVLFRSHREQLLAHMGQRLEIFQEHVIEILQKAMPGDEQKEGHDKNGFVVRYADKAEVTCKASRLGESSPRLVGLEDEKRFGSIDSAIPAGNGDEISVEHEPTGDSSFKSERTFSHREGELLPDMPPPDMFRAGSMKSSTRLLDLEKKTCTQRIVDDARFEIFFGLAIITNAIFIGVQSDHVARNGSKDKFIFDVIGLVYTLLFTMELGLKMYVERLRFFWGSSSLHWNYIDVIIVSSSLVEAGFTVALWAPDSDEGQAGQSTSQFRILRIMRITRLIKVIRIARIIKFIRALRTMVHQLLSTVKSLLWAMFLLVLIIYLFAILFTQAYSTHVQEIIALGELEDFTDPLYRYWSTLPRCMFTLFQSITGGVSWEVVVLPLGDLGAWSVTLFIGYISFAQFAVLNVLTGVFCQNAIDSAQHDQELVTATMLSNKQHYINSMKTLFSEFDLDGSGSLSVEEFMEHLNDENVKAYFDAMELDTSDIGLLFTLMNSDNTNEEIDLDEFISGCMRLRGAAKAVDMAKLTYMLTALSRRLSHFMARADRGLTTTGRGARDIVTYSG